MDKLKNISGIAALIIYILAFSIWYKGALGSYPDVPVIYERIQYYGSFMGMGLALLALTINAKNKIRQLIFYAGFNFFILLTIAFLLNQFFDILVRQNKIIFTLILMILSCIISYIFLRKST